MPSRIGKGLTRPLLAEYSKLESILKVVSTWAPRIYFRTVYRVIGSNSIIGALEGPK